MSKKNEPVLQLTRSCGLEIYPGLNATWHISKSNKESIVRLYLNIEADNSFSLLEDTEYDDVQPSWELTYITEELSKEDLLKGLKIEIPIGDDEERVEYLSIFYHHESEQVDNNIIEILDVKEDKLLLRIIGKYIDTYDSKTPDSQVKLFIETWFEKHKF